MPDTEDNRQIFVIIDGNSIVHRAYHALPPFTSKEGVLVNAVYGFFSFLFRLIRELQPKGIAVAFDLAAPTFRHQQFDGYKAKRKKTPDNLYLQIPIIKEALEAFNIKFFAKQGFEADDLLGTMANLAKKNSDLKIIIVSSDIDILQLVDGDIEAMILQRGISKSVIYGESAVREKFGGLSPRQLIDFKALRGDLSDNIPGVSGIGPKTAIELISKFNNLDQLYEAIENNKDKGLIKESILTKLFNQKDQAFLSRYLAEIRINVDTEFNPEACFWGNYNSNKVIQLFEKLGFSSLITRLPSKQGYLKQANSV